MNLVELQAKAELLSVEFKEIAESWAAHQSKPMIQSTLALFDLIEVFNMGNKLLGSTHKPTKEECDMIVELQKRAIAHICGGLAEYCSLGISEIDEKAREAANKQLYQNVTVLSGKRQQHFGDM